MRLLTYKELKKIVSSTYVKIQYPQNPESDQLGGSSWSDFNSLILEFITSLILSK